MCACTHTQIISEKFIFEMRSVQMSSFQKEPLRAAIKTSVNFVHNADGTRLTRSFMASSSETAIWIMHWLSYSLWHQLNFVSQNLLNRLRGFVFDCTTTLMRTITCRNSIDDSCVVLLIIHEPRHLSKPLRYMYVEKYKKRLTRQSQIMKCERHGSLFEGRF